MKKNDSYEYTKIRSHIWQIAEDDGVYCTLVRGSETALLIDTGYGRRDLRHFLEQQVATPYMVANSHGHPDHIGGNDLFDTIWAAGEEWDVIHHFEEKPGAYLLKKLSAGSRISLGDIHVSIVSLAGHTKGSLGFLIEEERLLIAGDALNESLWLFNYGSLSMGELYDTLKQTMRLDFSSYLCGHSSEEYPKEKIAAHIRNIEHLKTDERTKRNTIGFETYCSVYEDSCGRSEIVFTADKVTTGFISCPLSSVAVL